MEPERLTTSLIAADDWVSGISNPPRHQREKLFRGENILTLPANLRADARDNMGAAAALRQRQLGVRGQECPPHDKLG